MRLFLMATAGVLLAACGTPTAKKELSTQAEKVSYSIGLQMGKGLREQGIEVTPEILLAGLRDGTAGGTPRLTEEQMQTVMSAFQAEMIAKVRAKDSAATIENRKQGQDFLAANKTKPGVMTTPSGLQYKVITEGKGPRPTRSSSVTVHYRGTLLSGDEFDSSYKRNEPVTFPLGGVIPGWVEGLQLMNAGSKYQFFIPSELAYGEHGSPPTIGPNATLVFEVELLSFK